MEEEVTSTITLSAAVFFFDLAGDTRSEMVEEADGLSSDDESTLIDEADALACARPFCFVVLLAPPLTVTVTPFPSLVELIDPTALLAPAPLCDDAAVELVAVVVVVVESLLVAKAACCCGGAV